MKCVAVSDIHCQDVITPAADLLLVAGDITMQGAARELEWYCDWLSRQPQRHKVWIAGNHELGLEARPGLAQELAAATGSIYLEDSGCTIEGIKIWGTPVTPWFMDWAYNRRRGKEIAAHWHKVPEGTDILLSHGPPQGFLDALPSGESVGCADLLIALCEDLVRPPRYLVCGHIHCGYGEATLRRADGLQVRIINASSCNESYAAVNPPVVFELSPVG